MRHALAAILILLVTARAAWAQEASDSENLAGSEDGAGDESEERVDALARLDVSGYVQPELRYEETGDDPDFYFHVRRGRLKTRYHLEMAEFTLQFDATQDGVGIKDAWGGLHLPAPDGMEMLLMAGLFKIPFGFDLQHSSSRRVFPERSQLVRRQFPGERDLGLRLDASFAQERVHVQLAVQNGTPLGDAFRRDLPEPDGNGFKDLTARVALELGGLTVGASGLYGRGHRPEQLDDPDTMEDESMDAFSFPRWAAGMEVRFEHDIEGLGGLDAYGEALFARNMERKRAGDYPVDQDARQDVFAFYVAAVQELGEHFALGGRFERYDAEGQDVMHRVSPVAMLIPTGGTRVVLSYDIDPGDGTNNEGWLRLQVKF